jgi:ornithine carbamoyltransferase
MNSPLLGRSLLKLHDFSHIELRYILDLSHQVKAQRRSREVTGRFRGLSLGLLFEKPSTRTRSAFETAFGEEGGHPCFLSNKDIQLGAKETIEDTARVLGRMFDGIMFRGYKQESVEKLAKYSGVPVYNGLTDEYHPMQVLADLMTLEENWGHLEGKTLVYAGDARNNMANTLIFGCAMTGIQLVLACPEQLTPDPRIVQESLNYLLEDTPAVRIEHDLKKAIQGADAVYTDVWASMGEEEKLQERIDLLRPFQINSESMSWSERTDTLFLHCLPAVRGNEVTTEVIEGSNSRVWDQSENRKHTTKAVLLATLPLFEKSLDR